MALVSCGQSHTAGITTSGKCFTWGNAADGRLGLKTTKRVGVAKPHNRYFPEPVLVPSLVTERVTGISCGPSHTVCVTTTGVFSWGTGAGYRLGLGDTKDRIDPCRIEEFNGIHVKQVSCGTWHSAVVAIAPPFDKSGWVRDVCVSFLHHPRMHLFEFFCSSIIPGLHMGLRLPWPARARTGPVKS
jgi:alpha-tubulin suppressor-like RCC1 family protein